MQPPRPFAQSRSHWLPQPAKVTPIMPTNVMVNIIVSMQRLPIAFMTESLHRRTVGAKELDELAQSRLAGDPHDRAAPIWWREHGVKALDDFWALHEFEEAPRIRGREVHASMAGA